MSRYVPMDVGNLSNVDKVCCSFCGAIVLKPMWDDHVDWHQALELQGGLLTTFVHERLEKMEEDLDGC